ncbi:MAG: CDP-diacylglycerol--glycerol-3-phosphate 3-phosphatidyltransferase [Methylacidiphilales bacterium]|nr:CDP-diacylglycerol--glycerol-3-phosphate 3-phosphatidyltransferase [Candidatus Methylacidiphilales bacterium]
MTLRRAPTLNLPNQLTVLRLGLCGLFLITMSFDWSYAATTAFLIFTLASLTDWLDGEIARAWNLVTDLGKLLDPLADKILIIGALVALVDRHVAPMWMVVVIIAREFLITGLRIIAAHKQKILAAERVGKHKTVSQIVAILVSLACLSLGELGVKETPLVWFLNASQIWFYWIALIITVLSGAIYFWKNASIVNESMETASGEKPSEKPAPAAVEPPPAPSAPAFKEWESIVEALGKGAQIIILRKGGIAEGGEGFQPHHSQFWLFPTRHHQQWEKTKPELQRLVAVSATEEKDIQLHYFAEVTDAIYLSSWEQVARLDDAHFWSEEIMRERFDYTGRPGMEPGLHLLIVRVSRINLPHRLAPSPEFDGCKSWIDLPVDWSQDIATPVVRAEEFATRRSRILSTVSTVAVSTISGPLPTIATT